MLTNRLAEAVRLIAHAGAGKLSLEAFCSLSEINSPIVKVNAIRLIVSSKMTDKLADGWR